MSGRQWAFAFGTVGLVAGVACQRSPQTAPATGELRASSAASAPAVAGSWREFEPPADGRLTTAQVEMYVAVRRQAMASLNDSPGAGSWSTPQRRSNVRCASRVRTWTSTAG